MTQARFDVTSFGEMLLRLSVPSGDRLEAAKHLDIFPAGMIHGWLDEDLVTGLRHGVTLAALALSQFGDMVITNQEELLALGKSGGSALTR
jgi:hypothetical protein